MYENLLDDSPPSDASTRSGPALPLIAELKSKDTKSNGHYKKYHEEKEGKRRKHSEGAAIGQPNNGCYYNYR